MEQAAVVRAQGGGMFGQGQTLRIEERAFDYNVRDSGQEYKFFLVVRTVCGRVLIAALGRIHMYAYDTHKGLWLAASCSYLQ